MQCLSPIAIPNQSKFIPSRVRFPMLLRTRCGKCASCQQYKSAVYSFRSYEHFKDCVARGGFVYFDCLTYREKDVPRLKDYEEFELLPKHRNFYCFNRQHLRLFLVRLRKRLKSLGYERDAFTYFLSSEYGTKKGCTHRPHYHVLFFVYVPIEPLLFSKLVAESWYFGRTDGIGYKSRSYVLNNVFRSVVIGGRRVCEYVSKYVVKNSEFEKEIDKRVALIVLSKFGVDGYDSDEAKLYIRQLKRLCCQFHLQSHGFGLSALNNVNVDELIERGFFTMPTSSPNVVTRIPIANYYLRKLFYEKITLDDGLQVWSLNETGCKYMRIRQQKMLENLSNQYCAVKRFVGDFDEYDLADYVLNYRGRLYGDSVQWLQIGDILDNVYAYNYSSISDKNHFNVRFLSMDYLGYKDNYKPVNCPIVSIKEVVQTSLINDSVEPRFSHFETLLSRLEKFVTKDNDLKQRYFDKSQSRKNVYKSLF